MLNVPDNVRQNLIRLIPLSVVNDISCFVHYDNHPRDSKKIDITICTKTGEVKEFWQRELVAEICLGCSNPSEIKILRNNACELFYIVAAEDQLLILISRKDKFVIHRKVDNVERYDIDDTLCDGQACLKIFCKDDAVPLIFDEKLESLGDRGLLLSSMQIEETLPILAELNRKLIEAKYSVKCNENILKEYSNLRQLAAFSMYQKHHPNLEESVFKSGWKDVAGALNIKTYAPWVSVCNEKVVIVLNIVNNDDEIIENVHTLLHVKSRSSMVYTTKLFQKIHKSPFWEEIQTQAKDQEVALVTVVDLKEVRNNVTSRLDISGIIVYTKMDKEYILPFDEVSLSALDTMGEKFDVLSCKELDEYHTILAVLATTEKNELILRHIRKDEEPIMNIPATMCNYLLMERVKNTNNILIHRKSPYHPLNGLMVIFLGNHSGNKDCYEISLHTRTPDQVLAFIHYVNDALPYKVIITTVNQKIIAKTNEYSRYNEDGVINEPPDIDYVKYASAMLNQTGVLIEHLDTCMVKMNDTKDPEIQRLIGSQIDVFAAGVHSYTELRKKLLNEDMKGIKELSNKST